MKKNEMLTVDLSMITNENKIRYMEYYNSIFETIKETYACLYYLEGMEQVFGNYKKVGRYFELFVSDILKLLKQKVCLNICKLMFDSKEDELTIYNLHSFLINNFNTIVKHDKVIVSDDLRKRIIALRHKFISHNLRNDSSYSVEMKDVKPILDDIYSYFQKHWIKNFIDDNIFISDGYFDTMKQIYINAVRESFKSVQF